MDTPELSVVILGYRSGHNLIPFVEKFERELEEAGIHNYELVLVGNYFPESGDVTPEVIQALAKINAKVVPVTKEKQGMFGWDARMGFEAATGRHIALIDGDGQMLSYDIIRCYRELKEGGHDLAKTFRTTRHDGAYRKFISKIYNIFFRTLFPNHKFQDINSKPKLMTRGVYEQLVLTSDNWLIDAEIMLEAGRLKLKVVELPTEFRRNEWRKSFVKIWTIFEFVGYLAAYRARYWFNKDSWKPRQ